MPAVSVVIPAYNREQTISVSLDSLLAQTFTDWEAIIVDDGSSDQTADLAAAYVARDPRFLLIQQENAGVCAARNAGIERASGVWLFFLDADDWIIPTTLELLVGAVAHDPERTVAIALSVLVMPDGTEVPEPAPPPSDQMFAELARRCVYTIHTAIQPTALVRAVGGFDTSLIVGEDWDLWQRIARTRPNYVYIPEQVAYYRIRPSSASRSALRMLIDGSTVIRRGHAPDPRLADWPGELYAPIDPAQIPSAIIYTAAYCAGLAIGSGEDPRYLLEQLPDVGRHDAEGRWIADTLFQAVAAGMLAPVSAWPSFPPVVHERAVAFVRALAESSDDHILARTTERAFEALVAEQVLRGSGVSSATVGATHVVRVTLGEQVMSAEIPIAAERTLVELIDPREEAEDEEDQALVVAMVPATDGIFAASVGVDALAEEYAWELARDLLDETVFSALNLGRVQDRLVVRRGSLELGETEYNPDLSRAELIQRAAGWPLFMQELWGLPGLSGDQFYSPAEVPEDGDAHEVSDHGALAVEVEIAAPLPRIRSDRERVLVQVNLAGLPLLALRIPTVEGVLAPHRLRRAINFEGKFELCLVAVREAMLRGSWPRGTPLRARLRDLAERRGRHVSDAIAAGVDPVIARRTALLDEMVPHGRHALVLGRRRSRLFVGSACRLEVLPYASRELFTAAARRSGQLVLEHGDPKLPKMAMYLPHLFDPRQLAIDTDPDIDARLAEFEAFFTAEDPWDYANPYEQRKYDETLSLIPDRVESAIEVGCAEGHFTAMLAPRVGQLVAADIAPTALARAESRCAQFSNIEYRQLDLFGAPDDPTSEIEGRFDLVVCSEMLYFAPDSERFRLGLRRLVGALNPGGVLVLTHANLVIDEPDRPGFDWDLIAGAAGVARELGQDPQVQLREEHWSPYYRVQRWERTGGGPRLLRRRPRMRVMADVPAPEPVSLRRFLPGGGAVETSDDMYRTPELPVIMYHRIAPETPEPGSRWATTPEAFEEQLAWLGDQGYESASVEEWALACANDVQLEGRRVLLTFDDGLQDFADHALPLLIKYGYRADMHIVTGHVGGRNDWEPAGFPRYELMDWQTILDLPTRVVSIGAHTVHHPNFASLNPAASMDELLASRLTLEDRLGRAITRLAYPYGAVDDAIQRLAAGAGFDYAYTTDEWLAPLDRNLLRIPRLEARGGLTIQQFATLVTTGIQGLTD